MALAAGLTFRVASRFHCDAAWDERLRLNGGVVRGAPGFVPRDEWRRATAEELRLLIAEGEPVATGTAHLDLVVIPSHVRRRWWEMAAEGEESGVPPRAFDAFVGDVVELLRFKRLPVPARCIGDVVVSRPGQRSTRLDASGSSVAGFGFERRVPADSLSGRGAPLAAVNLGDEATQLVVLNLPVSALPVRRVERSPPGSADQLLQAFFAEQPAYPLIAVRLDPGEGLWLSAPPPAFDGWTVGKRDVDAILVLSEAVSG